MLPVLFTLTIPPSLGIVVWLALSAASGAWQVRSGRAAGEKELWKTFGTWTAGTAAVLYLAVRVLGAPGGIACAAACDWYASESGGKRAANK